jgi:hypothetical protein
MPGDARIYTFKLSTFKPLLIIIWIQDYYYLYPIYYLQFGKVFLSPSQLELVKIYRFLAKSLWHTPFLID